MKKVFIAGVILTVFFSVAVGESYWGIYMPSGRSYIDTVLTLPTATKDYFFCCTDDSVNFRFAGSDSSYNNQITLAPGQCHDSDNKGYKAKYVHINAPDASNTVSFWTQR